MHAPGPLRRPAGFSLQAPARRALLRWPLSLAPAIVLYGRLTTVAAAGGGGSTWKGMAVASVEVEMNALLDNGTRLRSLLSAVIPVLPSAVTLRVAAETCVESCPLFAVAAGDEVRVCGCSVTVCSTR